jgi:hypothetical protein
MFPFENFLSEKLTSPTSPTSSYSQHPGEEVKEEKVAEATMRIAQLSTVWC